jgi:hypothetical protein
MGEDRHGVLGADDRDRHDRHAGAHGGPDEPPAAEATELVALPVELARALLPLGEHERELAFVVQQPLRVRRVGGDHADLVGQRADPGVPLEPVLGEHVDRARGGVLVPDGLHDHRRVGRQGARVVGHQQRATLGGNVLDALLLDAEPVAVVEVEHGLQQVEDPLRPSPVVELAARLARRDQLA